MTFDDGEEYDAIIHSIERCSYGKDDGYYFRIVLWLVQREVFLVTNIYVREDNRTALQRHLAFLSGLWDEQPRLLQAAG